MPWAMSVMPEACITDPSGMSAPSVTQHPGDRGDGVPVARGDRNPEEPVEGAEVADDLHVAPVHAEDEPVVPGEDLQQPPAAGGKAHGRPRRRAGAFGQDAHEADDVASHGLVREMIVRDQPDDLAALADHDLGIEGKPAGQFGAELRPGDRSEERRVGKEGRSRWSPY